MGQLIQLHVGLGSFHRAHQTVYMNNLMLSGDDSWCIVSGNIRPDMPETIAALNAQNGEYTLETVTPDGKRTYELIKSIKKIIQYQPELLDMTKLAANPDTRIISFTVTEAGYYLDGDDNLDISSSDIQGDMDTETPQTIYGSLSKFLEARKEVDAGPVSLLCCDNLRSNGKRFYKGFQQFLTYQRKNDLLEWVKKNTSAPCDMVDRITPRPTEEVQNRVLRETGRNDKAAVMAESFIQWVIEDDFISGRPSWEKVGAQMVDDVTPYEEAKIRLLNATHTCIAWAGTLIGYQYIHEGVQNKSIYKMAYDYVTNDTIPCLDRPESSSPIDLADYRDVVLERFGNPNIQDTNQRVAMDSYSKIPAQIVPTIRESLSDNRSIDDVCMLPALFLAFLKMRYVGRLGYQYQDQALVESSAKTIFESKDIVQTYVNDKLIFDDMAGNEKLLSTMRLAYERVQAFQNKESK